MKKIKGIKFIVALLIVTIIPILIVSFTLVSVGRNKIKSSLKEGVLNQLKVAVSGLNYYYKADAIAHGTITYDHEYVDSLKDQQIELTLFLGDVRFITSIKDSANPTGRNEGTTAAPDIFATVKAGNDYSAENVVINGKKYFVYYSPTYDADNSFVGMAFAGIPESVVEEEITAATSLMFIVGIGIAVIFVGVYVGLGLWLASKLKVIDTGAKALAEGDLTYEVHATSFVYEFNSLAASTNLIRENTNGIVDQIKSASNDITNNVAQIDDGVNISNEAANGIVTAVEEISKGSMDMAESVQNTATAMQNIGDSIDEISTYAEGADKASKKVIEISNAAKADLAMLIKANEDTVGISVDVEHGINDASDAVAEISKAADVIAEIASQTNLLSLNASIEAARAGEAGRGFAVVAGNIQDLASQSSKSASEIKKIIENIVKKSQDNVVLANKIREAVNNEGTVLQQVNMSFEHVNAEIQTTADAINTIFDKAMNVNADKEKVLDEVSNLSSISEENAASCEETNASMEELSATISTISSQASDTNDQTKTLVQAVEYFKQ